MAMAGLGIAPQGFVPAKEYRGRTQPEVCKTRFTENRLLKTEHHRAFFVKVLF
jgi:hypothetical protein